MTLSLRKHCILFQQLPEQLRVQCTHGNIENELGHWLNSVEQLSNAEFISSLYDKMSFSPWLLSVLKPDTTGAFSANLKHSIFKMFWGSMPPDSWKVLKKIFLPLRASKNLLTMSRNLTFKTWQVCP